MQTFLRQVLAEGWKLRRSTLTWLPWVLPWFFLAVDLVMFQRPFLPMRALNAESAALFDRLPLDLPLALWGGFVHPLVLALLPALAFRLEHRAGTWRHLQCQPTPPAGAYLAKATQVLARLLIMLALLLGLLILEHLVLGILNPALARPFPTHRLGLALAWLGLGSLPMLALMLWISHRIGNLAVPALVGLVGFLLTASLSGQELAHPWKRDLMPWMLPYAAMERALHQGTVQQEVHATGRPFQPEARVLRLPSGRRVRLWQNIPDELLFPPPPPTSAMLLAGFSLGAGLLLLGLGAWDARRPRP